MLPFIRLHSEGVLLSIRLQPRAAKNEIGESIGTELKIRVTAPPVDAAANQALLELLADQFDCARSAVQLLRGHTSRHKVVLIRGIDAEAVEKKLLDKA